MKIVKRRNLSGEIGCFTMIAIIVACCVAAQCYQAHLQSQEKRDVRIEKLEKRVEALERSISKEIK